MHELEIQPLARRDLKEIWIYTYETWDAEQADRYLRDLGSKIALLESNPRLGRTRDDVRPGCRSLEVNRHVVYYRIDGAAVRVLRVLHDRMDPERRL